jgi:hypothetical protein
MDWLVVALIAGLAFWAGSVFGFQHGIIVGEAQAKIRARLDELGKPWER